MCEWSRQTALIQGDGRRREAKPGREHFYGNPALAGSLDGRLHVLYTFRGRAIKHVIVDEAWVMAGGTEKEKTESKSGVNGGPDPRLSKGVFKGDTENVAVPNPKTPAKDDPRLEADPSAKPSTGGVRGVPCCEEQRRAEAEEEMKEELMSEVYEAGKKK